MDAQASAFPRDEARRDEVVDDAAHVAVVHAGYLYEAMLRVQDMGVRKEMPRNPRRLRRENRCRSSTPFEPVRLPFDSDQNPGRADARVARQVEPTAAFGLAQATTRLAHEWHGEDRHDLVCINKVTKTGRRGPDSLDTALDRDRVGRKAALDQECDIVGADQGVPAHHRAPGSLEFPARSLDQVRKTVDGPSGEFVLRYAHAD